MIRRGNFSTSLTGVVLFCCLLVLSSCGYKDKPVAPQQVVPKAVTDLRHQLSEKGVTLYWSYPIETVTGEDLTDISEFIMYRAVVPIDSYCESCPIPFGPPISLAGGVLPNEGRKTASYKATLLRPGNLYFFKVRSKNGWWAESMDSNVVSFLWNTPALAPEGVKIVPGDGRISLSWKPVQSHLDGTPVTERIQYQVYRSFGGSEFVPVGGLLSDTAFEDDEVVNSRKYFYQVQAMSMYDKGAVGGGMSESVGGTPVDKTPPDVPKDVRGIKTGKGIKVYWSQVKAKDLKGYRVYRRLADAKAPQLVGEVELPYTMFIDTSIPAGAARVYYSVSSIDKRKPANESVGSPEIMVRN